ncbi:MAG: hypothetical protein A4E47_01389 [Methanosaeta sp. PtaU1.Bin028]|nr:MAG: hypothetical protein A4E47_01389 [Methanosaeta sp. PtaU1.Bin028]
MRLLISTTIAIIMLAALGFACHAATVSEPSSSEDAAEGEIQSPDRTCPLLSGSGSERNCSRTCLYSECCAGLNISESKNASKDACPNAACFTAPNTNWPYNTSACPHAGCCTYPNGSGQKNVTLGSCPYAACCSDQSTPESENASISSCPCTACCAYPAGAAPNRGYSCPTQQIIGGAGFPSDTTSDSQDLIGTLGEAEPNYICC